MINFIDKYEEKISALSVLNQNFIINFNKNVENYNQIIQKSLVKPSMIVVVKPHTKPNAILNVWQESNVLAPIILMSTLLFLLICYYRYKKKNSLKCFYEKMFSLSKKNSIKLKIFGNLDFKSLQFFKKIENGFLGLFLKTQCISKDAIIKFKVRKKLLIIEALYDSRQPIQSFLEHEAITFKSQLLLLKNEIEDLGGELYFSNRLNNQGQIVETGFIIQFKK